MPDRLPDGYVPIRAYSDGDRVVICGNPPDEEQITDPEQGHNCDEMGCGTLDHALVSLELTTRQKLHMLEEITWRQLKEAEHEAVHSG